MRRLTRRSGKTAQGPVVIGTHSGKRVAEQSSQGAVKVIRRPLFTWMPVTAAVVSYAFALWVALYRPHGEGTPSLAMAGFTLVFWILGWDSAIRYTAAHLSITNLLVTSTVAWQDVSKVSLEDGLGIELRDGRELDSIAFGGSLIGMFSGYPTHRKAYELLRDAHAKALQSGTGEGAVRLRLSVEWRQPLAAAGVIYGPVLIALAAGR